MARQQKFALHTDVVHQGLEGFDKHCYAIVLQLLSDDIQVYSYFRQVGKLCSSLLQASLQARSRMAVVEEGL